MPDNLCPICQRPNDANAERCWYCQAVLPHDSKPENKGGTDWLNSFRDDSTQSPEPAPFEPSDEKADEKPEEVPDWLARIRTREQLDHDAQKNIPAEPEPKEQKEDLPDWLKEIKAGNSGKKVEPFQEEPAVTPEPSDEKQPSAGQKEEDNTQDWLNRLAAWRPVENLPSEPTHEEEPEEPAGKGSTPQFHLNSLTGKDETKKTPIELNPFDGWQKLVPEESKVEPEPPAPISEPVEEPKIPSEEQTSFTENPAIESAEPAFDVESLREDLFSIEPTPEPENEPTENQAKPDEGEITSADERAIDRLFDFDQPDEQKDTSDEPKPTFTEALPASTPFVQDDLPDWLASTTVEKVNKRPAEAISEELDANALGSNLEKANLPAWLQAIRPSTSEHVSDSETKASQSVEERGLLAGIADTLESSQFSGEVRKPVGYGSALKVSERQKSNANLFASLVEDSLDENEVEEPKNDKLKRIVWRLALAVGLISIVICSDKLLAKFLVQPALFPPEVAAVYDQVNSIPVEKPVLLTADFEPAVTGELALSSDALLEHMMRRNLSFAILSTNASGIPILMQQLEAASLKVTGYDLASHVINLGYLPGGSTGLQLMSQDIRAAVPNTYDPYDFHTAWNSSVLQSVNSLNDFGAVLVLSDKAESARLWVEQIQPAMEKTPLLFVISAQSAPMVEPYYQSGQVSGYISGYSGSLSFEKIAQQTVTASDHLGAFQVSLLFITALILLGGLVNLIRPAVSQQKR